MTFNFHAGSTKLMLDRVPPPCRDVVGVCENTDNLPTRGLYFHTDGIPEFFPVIFGNNVELKVRRVAFTDMPDYIQVVLSLN